MNCDPIAHYYRSIEYAAFGTLLERLRRRFLPELAHCRRALVLGDGDGRFAAQLASRYPHIQIDAVDSSARMLALARSRAPHASFHLADARTFIPEGAYDLLATHFFLDCLTQAETEALAHRLAAALTPNGRWVVSEFAIPPCGWRCLRARFWLRIMYAFFAFATGLNTRQLPDHRAALEAAGLRCISRKTFSAGLVAAEIWTPTSSAR